jgi:hypothetical protein
MIERLSSSNGERLFRKQRVGGANPSWGSKQSDGQWSFDTPQSPDVDFERVPVLWLSDGRVLVRRAGF